MKPIIVVHRSYRNRGGEDAYLDEVLIPALELGGWNVVKTILPPLSSILEIAFMILGFEKLRPSFALVSETAAKYPGAPVIFNNFIPTISLALPGWLKSRGHKTLCVVHNSRVYCANGLRFNGREACTKCFDKSAWFAAWYNCHKNLVQSWTYAFIYRGRRVARLLAGSIDLFLPVSNYTADGLRRVLTATAELQNTTLPMASHLTESHVSVRTLRTPIAAREPAVLKVPPEMVLPDSFLLFMGRLSWEKGADLLPELAMRFSHTQILVAGAGPLEGKIRSEAPANLKLLGQITGPFKDYLFEKASALLLCSRVPENAPLVILESQTAKLPVIFTPGGGVEEYVSWLGRSSCTLDSYQGQVLARTGTTPTEASLASIAENLNRFIEAERQAQ